MTAPFTLHRTLGHHKVTLQGERWRQRGPFALTQAIPKNLKRDGMTEYLTQQGWRKLWAGEAPVPDDTLTPSLQWMELWAVSPVLLVMCSGKGEGGVCYQASTIERNEHRPPGSEEDMEDTWTRLNVDKRARISGNSGDNGLCYKSTRYIPKGKSPPGSTRQDCERAGLFFETLRTRLALPDPSEYEECASVIRQLYSGELFSFMRECIAPSQIDPLIQALALSSYHVPCEDGEGGGAFQSIQKQLYTTIVETLTKERHPFFIYKNELSSKGKEEKDLLWKALRRGNKDRPLAFECLLADAAFRNTFKQLTRWLKDAQGAPPVWRFTGESHGVTYDGGYALSLLCQRCMDAPSNETGLPLLRALKERAPEQFKEWLSMPDVSGMTGMQTLVTWAAKGAGGKRSCTEPLALIRACLQQWPDLADTFRSPEYSFLGAVAAGSLSCENTDTVCTALRESGLVPLAVLELDRFRTTSSFNTALSMSWQQRSDFFRGKVTLDLDVMTALYEPDQKTTKGLRLLSSETARPETIWSHSFDPDRKRRYVRKALETMMPEIFRRDADKVHDVYRWLEGCRRVAESVHLESSLPRKPEGRRCAEGGESTGASPQQDTFRKARVRA